MAEKKYIELEAVLEFVEPDARPFLAERIKSIPAADVRPVVRGKWENVEPNFMAKCSNCRRYYISRDEKYEFHFCPNCGAMMEG